MSFLLVQGLKLLASRPSKLLVRIIAAELASNLCTLVLNSVKCCSRIVLGLILLLTLPLSLI